jgi:DNA-binding SARP family transcriptional activator
VTRAGRVVRGLAAATALVAIVAGLPAALVVWGTSPLRGPLGWESLRDVFYELASERVLVGALTIAAWLVWALFLRALVAEIIDLRRGRPETLLAAGYGDAPPAGPLRTLARRLVTSLTITVGSMGPLASVAGAVTAPPLPALASMLPAPGAPAADRSPAPETPPPAPSLVEPAVPAAPMARVTVTEPSDAWNLADRLLGDGLRWKELWVHNRDRVQPDGQRWTNPESTVRAGWELVVPSAAPGGATAAAAGDGATGPAVAMGEVTVAAGDNFWTLAQRRLSEVWVRPPTDDETRPYWREMVELNRPRLAPPGDPDLIYPGQVFVTPAVPVDATSLVVDAPTPARPPAEPAGEPPAAESPAAEPPAAPPAPTTSAPAEPAPAGETAPAPVPPAPQGTSPATSAPPAPSESSPGDQPASPPLTDATDSDGDAELPVVVLAGGVLSAAVAVGVTRAIRRRRRRRNFRSPETVPVEEGGDEELHRRLVLDADEDLIGVVCRCLDNLAAQVAEAGQVCRPRVVQASGGHLDVLLDQATLPVAAGWQAEAEGSIWTAAGEWWPPQPPALPEDGGSLMAAPLLVTLGCPDDGGQLYLDLETAAVVSLTGDLAAARGVARTMLVELAHSPFAAIAQVMAVGDLGSSRLGDLERLRVVEDWTGAAADVTAWATQSAEALAANGWPNAFVGRGHDPEHDALMPLVVVATEPPDQDVVRAVQAAPSSTALVVVGDPLPGATVIECRREQLFLPQLGLTCRPQVLEPDDVEGLAELLEVAETSSGQMAFGFWESTHQASNGGDVPYQAPTYEVLVRVLGEITVEGAAAPLTRLQTALVAYLALHRTASMERINDAIWPNVAAKAPRKRLSNAVNKCRDALGRRHLPAAGDNHYSVGPGVATDVDLFDRRVATAARMPPARAAETLSGALDLVRGQIFQYPDRQERKDETNPYSWVSLENWISRTEPKIAAAAQRVAELYLELGEPARAVQEGERALQLVPHHSGLVEVLMQAHNAKGDRLAVHRVYSEHAEALERLDLDEPAESTAALYQQLRSGSTTA